MTLERNTPLKRGKELKRTEFKRKPPKERKTKRRPRQPGFTEETKARVRRRSANRCEAHSSVCTGRAGHFHHRKLRRSGDHSVENCLHVCTSCHDFMHLNRLLAYAMGWIVHQWNDPAEVAVRRGDAIR